jgi:hypothetical protein
MNDTPQAERFEETACAAECDEDEARFKERLATLVKHKSDKKPE